MACTALTKGRGLSCDRSSGGIKYVYFGVYDDFNASATTGEVYGTGIIVSGSPQSITDIEMGSNVLYRYTLPRGESSLTETIVGSTENGSVYYTPSITVKLNTLTTADQDELIRLGKSKLVVFAALNATLANGHNVIVGMGLRNGMRLNSGTDVSGAAWGDHNGYSWTFEGMEEEPMMMVADYTTAPFDNTAFTMGTMVIS